MGENKKIKEIRRAGIGLFVWAWINPPLETVNELARVTREVAQMLNIAASVNAESPFPDPDIVKHALYTRLAEVYSVLWSQGDDPGSHWSAARVKWLIQEHFDLFKWLSEETYNLVMAELRNELYFDGTNPGQN